MVASGEERNPQRERTVVTQQALRALAPSLRDIADETGLSYATLKAWSAGHRTPHGDNLRRLADALERRGGELHELAEKLREEAQG